VSPGYWQQARRELARSDPVMRRLMRRYRGLALASRGDAFATLARAIVGQQISLRAADSVWARLRAEVGRVVPARVAACGPQRLRDCGLSARKAEYLLDLAAHFIERRLARAAWPAMDDEAVIRDLVQVRGIGRWTAEMFLIFNLLRPNVLPLDDAGLVRAAGLLYFGGETPQREQLIALGRTWAPWRSVATWHLWRSLDPVPVVY
jgi:DNA-3-methyladenine glycosylase II